MFPDSKTFVDARPLLAPAAVAERYAARRGSAGFSLRAFVAQYFELPRPAADNFSTDTSQTMEHHIRALNTIRKAGSIKAAVDAGVLTGGIMHALVTGGKEYVLVGSVRDDGPLPDVYTDVLEGQRAMRAKLPGAGVRIVTVRGAGYRLEEA